eukprot:746834-Ditylum_brightwellii.AAC.1
MRKLSMEAQWFLQCAACLGTSFTIETLRLIWEHQRKIDTNVSSSKQNTEELLEAMVEENYFEIYDNNKYRWTHDNVGQAASSLVEEERRASFKHRIGEIWYQELDEDRLEPS